MSFLLAQDSHRREWAVPGVQEGVLGEPGRLHAALEGAGGAAEGREATEGPAEKGEADGKQETPGQVGARGTVVGCIVCCLFVV